MKQPKAATNKSMKLNLIHFLTNPKLKVRHFSVEKDTMQRTDFTTGYLKTELTGEGTITIQYYFKEENE